MSDLRIERMGLDDLDEILAIERASFTNPWSREAFAYELRENRVAHLWVVRAPDDAGRLQIVGYCCLWLIRDEAHVTNFAVHPTRRHQGIGRQLLGTLLEHYRQQGASRAALEVRVGNDEARRLYEGFGFRGVGLRKGYYFDTGEDALLMEARLDATVPVARGPAAGNPRVE